MPLNEDERFKLIMNNPNLVWFLLRHQALQARRQAMEESEDMLSSPISDLQKVKNAIRMVTFDPLEKAFDTVKNVFSIPDDTSQPSQKPSLRDIFFK